ncbi:MAG: hypothetical protein NC394_00005 [Bacteroides sp.]|nr:hypothetical protein [Bacteroides sp.]
MKTDEEMIKSLFKRRDEYYENMKSSEARGGGKAALKTVGAVLLPFAAAAAVVLTLVAVQQTVIKNDIDLTDSVSLEPDDGIAPSEDNGISANELIKLYESDRSRLSEDFKALEFTYTPMCISYNGKLYKSESYMTSKYTAYGDFAPAADKEACRYSAAGTARLADLTAASDDSECTVFDVVGKPECKAVIINGVIELYREMGPAVQTVRGIDFEIMYLHKTSERCYATRLPVLQEGESIIYRAYDISGNPVTDTFILYTPELTGIYSEYAVWEVKGEVPYELLGEYPAFEPVTLDQFIRLCIDAADDNTLLSYHRLNEALDELKVEEPFEKLIHSTADNKELTGITVENSYQLYYAYESGTEFAVEIYDDSDGAVLTKIATNESMELKDITYLYSFMDDSQTTGEASSGSITYSRFKSLVEQMNNGSLTAENIIAAGGIVWTDDPHRFSFRLEEQDADYFITAVVGNDGRVQYFTASTNTLNSESFAINTVSAFEKLFGKYKENENVYITYAELLDISEKAADGTLTPELIEELGASPLKNGKYALYYDLYSEVYFKTEISFFSDGRPTTAVIVNIETSEELDLTEGKSSTMRFIAGYEEQAYMWYTNTIQHIDYSELKNIAEMAKNKTLTVKYAESIGAKHTNDGTQDCSLFYSNESFNFDIYISATASDGIKSVTLINTVFKYRGDNGINLVTQADILDQYLDRYTVSMDDIRAIAEKCGRGAVTFEDFINLNPWQTASCALVENETDNTFESVYTTVYELYCGKYKLSATEINGEIKKVFLSYVFDTVDVGIDLMTEYGRLEIFLGNEPFPDVYTLEPITDRQLDELTDIIRSGDYTERDRCNYNKIENYILKNTDHLISGAFYDEYRIIYEKNGKKYVIAYSDALFETRGLEIRDDSGKSLDLLNDLDSLEDFLEDGVYDWVYY